MSLGEAGLAVFDRPIRSWLALRLSCRHAKGSARRTPRYRLRVGDVTVSADLARRSALRVARTGTGQPRYAERCMRICPATFFGDIHRTS